MKQQVPRCTVLYSDTDSLLYEIETDDLTSVLRNLADHFDFSNYPTEHPLYDRTNHRVVLKMKDELAGDVITDFVGLKAKMYSIVTAESTRKQSAKGVTRHAQRSLLHDKYQAVLESGQTVRSIMHRIQTKTTHCYHRRIPKDSPLEPFRTNATCWIL